MIDALNQYEKNMETRALLESETEDETVKDKMKHLLEGYYKVRFRGDAAEPELIREMHALARSC